MVKLDYKVEGGDFTNAGYASSQVKKVLKKLNVDPKITRRVVVSLYEAEVNIVAHAFRGDIFVEITTDKINIKLVDEGPGISNVDEAMKEGFSTASSEVRAMGFGAGMGLSNINKNTDNFIITSKVGVGTTLEMITNLKQ